MTNGLYDTNAKARNIMSGMFLYWRQWSLFNVHETYFSKFPWYHGTFFDVEMGEEDGARWHPLCTVDAA